MQGGKCHVEPENEGQQVELGLAAGRVGEQNGRTVEAGQARDHDGSDGRKQDEERIRYQANYDALTQLPNRWLFQARLTQAIERSRLSGNKLALLYANVNQFKFVNDSLGHRAGDELLKELARRLLGIVRHGDTVARLGGDEFAVIAEDFRDDEPMELLPERLLRSIADPVRLESGELVVGASVGVALYPNDGTDGETLARNAATAMRHAKEQRASAFRLFDGGMETRALERLKLETRLRRALGRSPSWERP